MAERVTFSSNIAQSFLPMREVSRVVEPAVARPSQLDVIIEKVRKDPYRVINNPELIRQAAAWSLKTVEVFHLGLGIPENLREPNKQRREEELNERIERLHGDESVRATNGTRKNIASGLTQVFATSTEIWDSLNEEQRKSVTQSLEIEEFKKGKVIFSRNNSNA